MLYDRERHQGLHAEAWEEGRARAAIADIVADADACFEPERLWPVHPLEWGSNFGLPSFKMLYVGAAGVIWALDYLARIGATPRRRDYRPFVAALLDGNRRDFQSFMPDLPAYLVGDVGILLVARRLTEDPGVDALLAQRIGDNIGHPSNELMAGTPGTMLAALFLYELTGGTVWHDLFLRSADQVWDEWKEVPQSGCHLWMQDFQNQRAHQIGAVHGFAGTVQPLLRGARLLAADRQAELYRRCAATAQKTAITEDGMANWPQHASLHGADHGAAIVQYCHGSPGVIVALSELGVGYDAGFDRLLTAGGELIWRAGPLTKGPGLCHGTAGNGYAFLKLYRRTGDSLWLDRARAFAMHAIAQSQEARAAHGRGRYSLWTGGVGLAVYLWHCLNGSADFPTIDVF